MQIKYENGAVIDRGLRYPETTSEIAPYGAFGLSLSPSGNYDWEGQAGLPGFETASYSWSSLRALTCTDRPPDFCYGSDLGGGFFISFSFRGPCTPELDDPKSCLSV